MANATPDPRTPVPPGSAASSRRFGDALVAILLLLVQPVLALFVLVVVGFRAMGVGACAYEGCGHQAWLDWVMGAADLGSLVVLVLAAVSTRRRYVRHQDVWFVPLIGYGAQVGLGLLCWAIIAVGSQ